MSYVREKCCVEGCSRMQAMKERRCGQKWYRRWCSYHHHHPDVRAAEMLVNTYKPLVVEGLVIHEDLWDK